MSVRAPTHDELAAKWAITEVIHRYCRGLDRFECIEGMWAIRHRQSVVDWNRVDPVRATLADFAATPLIDVNNPEVPATVPSRDGGDFSYSVLGHLERH